MAAGLTSLVPADIWKAKGSACRVLSPARISPIISTGDFSGWGDIGPNGSDREVFEMHDDMTKTHGAHTFKWGYFFGDSHYDGFGAQYRSGGVGFSST